MCSLTFLPRRGGFVLAMNRDESRQRPAARPPEIRACGRYHAIYPSEPGGGTWVGVNERGLTLALLNWYAHEVERRPETRGRLIPTLLAAVDAEAVAARMAGFDLRRTGPFRLLVFDPSHRCIREFQWNGHAAGLLEHPWKPSHWFSSGLDEPAAAAIRSATARTAAAERGSRSVAWVRRLHASHLPQSGPFSFCMHRADAETVSLSEIRCTEGRIAFRYVPGPPCRGRPAQELVMPNLMRQAAGHAEL